MSQDGELVYELVTTKYKIAEKNRIAKYRFLNKAERKNESAVINRRGSEPLSNTTMESNVNEKIDYSVPGTPVSSRNIEQLRKHYKNIESDSEDEGNLNDQIVISSKAVNSVLLEETLKKFTADMEELQRQATAVNVSCDEQKKLDTYFVESDKKNTYRREFSDVAGTIDFGPKPSNKAKVDQYFQDSIRMNSFKREFPMETFDPQSNKFYNLSIPGTPISSRFIDTPKHNNLIDTESEASNDESNDNSDDSDEERADGEESDDNLSIVTLKNSHEDINEIEQHCNGVTESQQTVIDEQIEASVEEIIKEPTTVTPVIESKQLVCEIIVKDEKGLKIDITVPGTPVSSRRVSTISTGTCSLDDDDYSSQDDYNIQVKQLANECVNVIEDLLQKVLDGEQKSAPEVLNIIKAGNENSEEVKATTDVINKNIISSTSSEQHTVATLNNEATSLELLNRESSENYQNIQNYLEKSSLENSYQRTFSEVEKFNEPLPGAKRKINEYFEQSEQKMTFQRPFSEVFSYLVNVEPNIKATDLTIPGTPISSQQIMSLKEEPQSEVPITPQCNEPFSANDYFTESLNRNTFQRSFSETVDKMGMPIVNKNSEEINNYFTFSDQQKSYQRTFSEAIQEMPSRIEDILLDPVQESQLKGKVTNGDVKKERTLSVCSNQSNKSIDDNRPSKLYGKKYGIDKYFATSLYRTAYHRSTTSRRQSTDDDNDDITDELGADNTLNIFEDERAFDGQDHFNEAKVRQTQFWKDFMKTTNI